VRGIEEPRCVDCDQSAGPIYKKGYT
jgi:hypothetical protein